MSFITINYCVIWYFDHLNIQI